MNIQEEIETTVLSPLFIFPLAYTSLSSMMPFASASYIATDVVLSKYGYPNHL